MPPRLHNVAQALLRLRDALHIDLPPLFTHVDDIQEASENMAKHEERLC